MKPVKIILIAALCLLVIGCVGIILYITADTETPFESDTDTSELPFEGVTMVMYTEKNPSLPFDLNAFMKEDGAYFFLPGDVKTDSVTFTAYDADGDELSEFTNDFSTNTSYSAKLPQQTIKVTVMQTDLPSMNVSVNQDSSTFAEVVADKYKKTSCYGDAVIYVPNAYASEHFCSDSYKTVETDENTPGSVQITGRGHSSWMYLEKKNFSFKTEEGFAPLGMDKDKSWVLVSNHYDRSLLRNQIILDLYEKYAKGYSVDYRFIELYVDGDYYGTYMITEKVQIDKDRINITDLEAENELLNGTQAPAGKATTVTLDCGATVKYWPNVDSPDDITGGYLLEVEIASRAKQSASYIKTSRDIYYNIKSPEYVSYEEAVYIAEYIQDYENAVYSREGYNDKGKHFTEYIDLDSLALRYVIDEICRNVDSGTSSTFFYKDSDLTDSKLYSGPLWDYDLAFGNYAKYSSTDGFEALNRYYFGQLMSFSEFSDQADAWYDVIMPEYKKLAESGINAYAAKIRKSAEMNFTRWDVFGIKLGVVSPVASGESLDGAVDYVRKYLTKRIKWIEKNF